MEKRRDVSMERIAYFDNAATTPTDPRVMESMLPFYKEQFGNPSSIHRLGRQAQEGMETAREQIAGLIGASPEEIIFTSGGTEADNLAIKGIAWAHKEKGDHIITTSIEHHGVLNPCTFLEKQGFRVTYLTVDSTGLVDLNELEQAITKSTILISVIHANNEVGTIQPLEEIGALARERDVLFHTDAVQSVGKLDVDVKQVGVHLLALSGHKLHGPKGMGALYVKKGVRLTPLFHGGHHERNRRAGTENVPGIVGLGRACAINLGEREEEQQKVKDLRDRLHHGLLERIPDVTLNGHPERRLPNMLNLCFHRVEGEAIILHLDMNGIAASTGSACASGTIEPSHVLMAMGSDPMVAHSSVRFSLGRGNTEEDVDRVIEVLPGIIERLRAMSPLSI
jgi:cysteine desulfurase